MGYRLGFRCPMPLLPMENGQRHCHSCERTVTDLCGMSEAEASVWLKAHAGNACGRLKVDRGGQLWAGALLLGMFGRPAVAGYEELEGDIVVDDSIDRGFTRGLFFYTSREVDETVFETLRKEISHHPGPFRVLLQTNPGRHVVITFDAAGAHATVEEPPLNLLLTPAEKAAITRIEALDYPRVGTITVSLRPE